MGEEGDRGIIGGGGLICSQCDGKKNAVPELIHRIVVFRIFFIPNQFLPIGILTTLLNYFTIIKIVYIFCGIIYNYITTHI